MEFYGNSSQNVLINVSNEMFNSSNSSIDFSANESTALAAIGSVLYELKDKYILVHGHLAIVLCIFGVITNVSKD